MKLTHKYRKIQKALTHTREENSGVHGKKKYIRDFEKQKLNRDFLNEKGI